MDFEVVTMKKTGIFLCHVKAIDKDGKPWRADILKQPPPFRIVPVNDPPHSPPASKRPRREDIIAEVHQRYGVTHIEIEQPGTVPS